jgi:hypothetical protein
MKHLKTFESYEAPMSKEEMISHLCNCGWEKHELEDKHEEELAAMCKEVPSEMSEAKSDKWIADAIKRPGALRRKLHKEKGEKISGEEISSELSKLKKKDKDKEKPGLQLSASDRRKQKQLVLAKTLKGM